MRMRTAIFVVFSLVFVACAPDKAKARHTVDEYRVDAELRREQLAHCAQDPGTLRGTPDCINAQSASAFEDRTSLREAPAVGLKDDKGLDKKSSNHRED
jgi:hypothetical protein